MTSAASSPIEFYFDFSSPYGYLAARIIDAEAAELGRKVTWRPFLLGAVMKQTKAEPLLTIPIKGDYARHDLARAARYYDIPFVVPPQFPFASIAACRAFYWLNGTDPAKARDFALFLYERAFLAGKDISKPDSVLEAASDAGLDAAAMALALQDPAIKELLKAEVDKAIKKGVFGSPFFLVDGEPFWGHDRIAEVREWLRKGGW
ncbi:2-hydroxychromene-2-carboxylate isomerase [Limibacillus halophilus]|uniref:2-hydroxychromene-2-carboxylate isomerase n=1 Tax=Limibacillus halophilus TaxID=1579333 RepID=A0A839STY9_9PROT|nr:2-hydroxychromene-2-carboxylate isomerase [Limibacillus halophilus]MBB3064373.1 2-hydroxychromene-2-carboxylate isomerase [Limibacillus halophilus]